MALPEEPSFNFRTTMDSLVDFAARKQVSRVKLPLTPARFATRYVSISRHRRCPEFAAIGTTQLARTGPPRTSADCHGAVLGYLHARQQGDLHFQFRVPIGIGS